MLNSFKQYLIEEEKVIYFSFGRMNPPTIGHEKLLDRMSSMAGKNPYRLYLSQSQDSKKNPLSYNEKVKFARKMFPRHARNIHLNVDLKNIFDIANQLYSEGYNKIVMVVGEDRVGEFEKLLNKYNGVSARHGFYNFEKITVKSAGRRDPDAEGVTGMSASKMRKAAVENDFIKFSQGLPSSFPNKESKELFNAVRKGLGIQEEVEKDTTKKFPPTSETREAYISGELFKEGDNVIIKESGELGTVAVCGANYLIVDTETKRVRKWLDDVELIEKEDPDIGDREGSQPKQYYKGIKTKSTKLARARHFEKGANMDDDDPAAYKPAPGDATSKTKPSKYTKKFNKMFGEEVTQKQIDDLEKFADRLLQKFDIDIEFTRHFVDRMNDARNNPEITIPEIQRLFKKIQKNKGKNIRSNAEMEVVLKDITNDLNLPVAINYKDGEFEVVHKTIMRKKNFKTPNKVVTYEEAEEDLQESNPDKSVKDKAEKAGIPYKIAKEVFDRGIAAWRTGHRPGTTAVQWGLARLNSFATGGKTTKTADKDLFDKWKGKKEAFGKLKSAYKKAKEINEKV